LPGGNGQAAAPPCAARAGRFARVDAERARHRKPSVNDAHLTRERLYAYSDGLLPAAERRAAERHLAACVACRQQLTQSKQIVRALKAQRGQERASQALYATIRQQIGAQEAPAAGDSLSFSRGLALASALIVLVLVLTIIY